MHLFLYLRSIDVVSRIVTSSLPFSTIIILSLQKLLRKTSCRRRASAWHLAIESGIRQVLSDLLSPFENVNIHRGAGSSSRCNKCPDEALTQTSKDPIWRTLASQLWPQSWAMWPSITLLAALIHGESVKEDFLEAQSTIETTSDQSR